LYKLFELQEHTLKNKLVTIKPYFDLMIFSEIENIINNGLINHEFTDDEVNRLFELLCYAKIDEITTNNNDEITTNNNIDKSNVWNDEQEVLLNKKKDNEFIEKEKADFRRHILLLSIAKLYEYDDLIQFKNILLETINVKANSYNNQNSIIR